MFKCSLKKHRELRFINLKSMDSDDSTQQLINRIRDMFSINTVWKIEKLDELEIIIADSPRNIGQYKSIDELNAKILERNIRNELSVQLEEKNVTLSEEDFKKIIDTIVESRIKQR